MITLISEPASGSTVQDDMWHIVTSDNSGQTDFKYVYDIFIGGEQKIRVKKFPEPSNGQGYFDAGAVVRNYMTYEWFAPQPTVHQQQPNDSGEISIKYDVRYGEDYSGLTYLNLASGTTKGYNFRPSLWKRRRDYLSSKVNKFLTNRPLVTNINLAASTFMIPYYTDMDMYFTVTTYDQNNEEIETHTDHPDSGVTVANGFAQLNLSPVAINNRIGRPFIDSRVKYYIVYMYNPAGAIPIQFNVVCSGLYTPMPLHFLNEWGMYDTARFDLVSRLNMEVDRKSFTQSDHKLGATTVEYYDANNVYRETKINYGSRSGHTYKLTMDCPTDAEYQWLAELIMSPQIYLEYDGYFYPVTIKTNNYEYSTIQNNRMKPMEIEIEVNQPRYSHRR